jgi:tetratricopeptide (TPR) repeat protein
VVNGMSLEFTYSGPNSYRTYLAGLDQRDKIDVAIAKPVRAAIGVAAEIYGGDRPLLRAAVRDLRFGGPDGPCEVLTVNLTNACAALDPLAADVVGGFQALFDEEAPSPRPAGETGEAERLLARLADLTGRRQFAEALAFVHAVLVKCPAICAQDSRFAWLRARLLAGIAGQPKSVAVLDLPYAERAFIEIAARAERVSPTETAAALVAAGKCAYADGRFKQAEAHCRAALEHAPGAGEAWYQLARLRRHAGDRQAVRESLGVAFGIAYGYAMRAASDPLFRADAKLLRDCARAATGRAAAATREVLAESLARLHVLARGADRDFPAAALAGFAPARDEIVARVGEPVAATLRKALRQRKAAQATRAPLRRLAQDYCALLRQNQETIARRGVERRPARGPDRVARWLTRATEASVVGMLIAVVAGTFDFAAAAPFPEWNPTASTSALGLALAVFHLWLLMHTSFLRRPTRSFFERAVAAVQAGARARFERRIPGRIAHNRRRLHERIRHIERAFGIGES